MSEGFKGMLPGLNAAIICLLILIFFKGDTTWFLVPVGAFVWGARKQAEKIQKWFCEDIKFGAHLIIFSILSLAVSAIIVKRRE